MSKEEKKICSLCGQEKKPGVKCRFCGAIEASSPSKIPPRCGICGCDLKKKGARCEYCGSIEVPDAVERYSGSLTGM